MKVVINNCYGSFGLSNKALELYSVYKYGKNLVEYKRNYDSIVIDDNTVLTAYDIERDDPVLVKVVEELGKEAGEISVSNLQVKEIPDGSEWEIEEYNGKERLRKPAYYY